MGEVVVLEIVRDHIHRLADHGKRIDGRGFDEVRPISIEKGLIGTAEGSARVKLGKTDVLVGVKVDIGEPFSDRPKDGVLLTGAELKPMASPEFESGPPRPNAIELARVVDRGIRESKMFVLEKLCIDPGKKVWMVFVDVQVIDFDGNLFDASSMAALAALTTTTVNASKFDQGEDFPLPIEHYPASCTIVKIGNVLMVDPSLQEEQVANARLTIVMDEANDIRAMQKGFKGAFTYDELMECMKKVQVITKDIRKKVLG